MADDQDYIDALRDLLESLEAIEAHAVAEGIRSALMQGIRRHEAMSDGRRLGSTAAGGPEAPGYSPLEALVVAVRLIAAAIEPIFMVEESSELLASKGAVKMTWEFDQRADSETSWLSPRATSVAQTIGISPEESAVIRHRVQETHRICDELLKDVQWRP